MEQVLQRIFSKKLIRNYKAISLLAFCLISFTTACSSAKPTPDYPIILGKEYREFNKSSVSKHPEPRYYVYRFASYFTDRAMDLVDIFKFDVGVGPAWGVVARVTEYGQVGIRTM